jgi:hypothetical protein
VLTVGAERAFIRTRHGLDVVPRHDLTSVPTLDRMLIPGQPDAASATPVERWMGARPGRVSDRIHAGGGFPYDLTIADMANHETRLIARNAARWIEYPTAHLVLGNRDWEYGLILRAMVLSALSLAMLLAIKRARRRPVAALHDELAPA